MKRYFRILGGISMFFGALFLIGGVYGLFAGFRSNEIENLPVFAIAMLLIAAVGEGLLHLGYRPYRKNGGKAKTPPKAVVSQNSAHKTPCKRTREENERLKADREALQSAWEEAENQRKKERAEFLKPWRLIDPADAEHIGEWEEALECDCAMSRHFVVGGNGDERLDGTFDHTDIDWFCLHPAGDLQKTIRLYAQIDTYRKACEAHGRYAAHTENRILSDLMNSSYDQRFLILFSEDQFAALAENTEECMEMCRAHALRILRSEGNNQYYDYVGGETLEVYVVSTFPGSADDAATYGSLGLRTVAKTSADVR